ncbi:hypothetical protein QJS10_CPA01g01334 [Acorus calamus]|uniref:Uncharacterized protein n=1 Tax=Acorus calamus TaxID=4465 RepID=A0AAV9FMW0_ACOCL|nr:hypothetical protein QJS10_CPA01g01334 [Acorus calamus]
MVSADAARNIVGIIVFFVLYSSSATASSLPASRIVQGSRLFGALPRNSSPPVPLKPYIFSLFEGT